MSTRVDSCSESRQWAGHVRPSVLAVLGFLGTLALGAHPAPAEAQEITEQQLSFMLARNAKQLCSVIFVVGRTPEEAMGIGDVMRWGRLRPDWWDWDKIDTQVDLERKRVTLGSYPAAPRSAVFNERQGCSMLPLGEEEVFFDPTDATPNLSRADETPWPMGDVTDGQAVRGINQAAVEAVLDLAYEDNDPERGERGWVVLHDGLIAGERYASGYDENTRNLSFSAGKSVQSTLVGILVHDGHLDVNDPAPISEWEAPDARSLITIENLLNMASGLDCNNFPLTHPLHFSPENHHAIGYNDGVDAFRASVAPPLRFVPGSVYRYRNCDLLAVGGIVREAVEREYDIDFLAFPQRALFDRIGARNFIIEPDPYGNFLLNGHNYVTTRDWARFGLLYQQDGVFNGERILPEGWADFVSTPSPANPGYGAFFWLATPQHERPRDAYWASCAEGQQIVVLPSHGVVVARNAWSPTNTSSTFDSFVAEIADAVVQTQSDCGNSGWRDYGFEDESQCLTYVGDRGDLSTAQAAEQTFSSQYELDPDWPRLPAQWKLGDASSFAVDGEDNVWLLHRPRTLSDQDFSSAAPPIVVFDADGEVIDAWGGDGPGYQWPQREHFIHLDESGNVWLGGNYCPDRALPRLQPVDDDQVLKFSSAGEFLLQIGRASESGGNADRANLHQPADAAVYAPTNEVFVADGYGNHRVIVFDADTGAYKRMWGAFGDLPEDDDQCPPPARSSVPDGQGPDQFSIVHAIRVSHDGIVYVADRENRRVQTFTTDGRFLKQLVRGAAPFARNLTLSPDSDQRYLYVGGGDDIVVVDRVSLEIIGNIQLPGMIGGGHQIAADSRRNLYVAGSTRGMQKLVFTDRGERP